MSAHLARAMRGLIHAQTVGAKRWIRTTDVPIGDAGLQPAVFSRSTIFAKLLRPRTTVSRLPNVLSDIRKLGMYFCHNPCGVGRVRTHLQR